MGKHKNKSIKKNLYLKFSLTVLIFVIVVTFFLLKVIDYKNNIPEVLADLPQISFESSDRILIIAPHPDDEILANSSVIMKGKKAGSSIKIMFVTYGEHNTSTLIKKYIFPLPFMSNHLADVRHEEAINAARILGLDEKDLIFLGFPDFGTLKIWVNHFDNKPYVEGLNFHDRVFQKGAYKENVPFTANDELKLFEEIILSYKPTKIFFPSTFDLNPDHRATGLFT